MKYFVKFVLSISLSFFSLSLIAAEGSHKEFFYSKLFAERFGLASSNVVSEWNELLAVSVQRISSTRAPQCDLILYMGSAVEFSYPGDSDYINLADEEYQTVFSFRDRLSNNDEIHLMNNSIKAINKIELKSFDLNNKMIAMNGLTIRVSIREAVPGVNIIKTLPFFCDLMNDKASAIKLMFLDSVTNGYITKSTIIQSYVLPIAKSSALFLK